MGGAGIYTAEHFNHAQFFSQEVCGQEEGVATVLLCRAFLGQAYDCGEWSETGEHCPESDNAVAAIQEGTHHSTTGCEWPDCPGMREYILPHDDQVLPGYIIYGVT